MDNVPHGLQPGRNYVTVVAADNEQNAIFATEELVKAIGGRCDVALITYSYDSYYSIAARRRGFDQTLANYPDVRLAAVEKFTQPSEVYQKTMRMLTAHPGIKGIFAVWGDPAMQVIAGAKAMDREDIVVTTNDLGPDTALYVARGQIFAIGAQLPYDLGVAEANAALHAHLSKPVAPYISIAALGVKQANLLPALEMVTKRSPPPEAIEACAGKCVGSPADKILRVCSPKMGIEASPPSIFSLPLISRYVHGITTAGHVSIYSADERSGSLRWSPRSVPSTTLAAQ